MRASQDLHTLKKDTSEVERRRCTVRLLHKDRVQMEAALFDEDVHARKVKGARSILI